MPRKFHSVWGLSAVVGKKYATSAAHLKAPASQNFPRKETKRRTDGKKAKLIKKRKRMMDYHDLIVFLYNKNV